MPGNEQIVRRYFQEVLNQGNEAAADELVHPNAKDSSHNQDLQKLGLPTAGQGNAGAKQAAKALRDAVGNLQFTLQNVREHGDRVEFEWTARGTHKGHLMGHGASNKQASVSGRGSVRIQDGKIIEGTSDWDPEALRRQLS